MVPIYLTTPSPQMSIKKKLTKMSPPFCQDSKIQKKSKLRVCISRLPSTPSGASARAKNTTPAGDRGAIICAAGRDEHNRRGRGAGNRYENNPKTTDFAIRIRAARSSPNDPARKVDKKSAPKNKKPRIPRFLPDLAPRRFDLAPTKTIATPHKSLFFSLFSLFYP